MEILLAAAAPSRRRLVVARAAEAQGGVLGRRQLLALGLTRWEIKAELRAQRWQSLGRQSVCVTPIAGHTSQWWRALLEVGTPAVLDGVSALVAAGLRGVTEDGIHVAVPKSADPCRCQGVVVHETRRFEAAAVVRDDIPRMRPATAAVHGALWARTDREAMLLVVASAQQRLFSAADLADEVAKIRRDRRRRLLRNLLLDICEGVESVGELDFARLCVAHGLPQPERQVWSRGPSGHRRWDNVWHRYRVKVEIDGLHHLDAQAWIDDALKQNEGSLDGYVVLRIPNAALRTDPSLFLKQVASALRLGGWTAGATLPAGRPTKGGL